MRRKQRLQRGAGMGNVVNVAHKWMCVSHVPPPRVCDVVRRYGSLALLVSKSYFECNVLEIILERKQVKLCEIPAIIYLTKQKWEVMFTWRRYFILLIH
jgi:hypothetical protein